MSSDRSFEQVVQLALRRCLDISMAACLLILAAIPMLLIACLIWLTASAPVLIRQQRVGRGGRFFELIKFRSMAEGEQAGSGLTVEGDSRLTPIGVLLRRFKLDELPQLYNVLRGDMSIVGPRPRLPQFAEIPNMPYLPGITGLASIAFRSEGRILRCVAPERIEFFYQQRIKPVKANLDVCYMCRATPASDARLIAATAVSCLAPGMVDRLFGFAPQVSPFCLDSMEGDGFAAKNSIRNESCEAFSGCE